MSRPARRAKRTGPHGPRPLPTARPVVEARPAAAPPDADRINAINIGLMLVSAALAWVAPFQLFLLSYAILGPLHYLTEISWLHDRDYFTTSRWDVLPLCVLCLLAFTTHYLGFLDWDGWVLVAFGLAGAFAFTTSPWMKGGLAAIAVVASVLVQQWGPGWLILTVLLPTMIHVFVFTGLFILQGSIRSRSAWGYASLVVFVACGLGLLLYRPPAGHYVFDPRTRVLVDEFIPVIDVLARLTGTATPGPWEGFVAIGRFLGFAYTYHYLNWFSKTGIIRWHAVSRRRMAAIGGLYVASLAVYAWSYATGLVALFVLSLLHVLLEFPLDLRTIASLAGRPYTPAPAR